MTDIDWTKRRQKMNRPTGTKLLKGLAIISGALTLLFTFSDNLLMLILKLVLKTDLPSKGEAAAIGIIGGADGPTSIFIAGTSALNNTKTIGALVSFGIFVLCIIGLRKQEQSMKRED